MIELVNKAVIEWKEDEVSPSVFFSPRPFPFPITGSFWNHATTITRICNPVVVLEGVQNL